MRKSAIKKILYITGSRADFGRAYYILKAIKDHPYFKLHIIATSMHLTPEFGYTIKEVEEKFHVDERVDMLLCGDEGSAMAKSFGIGIVGITQSIEKIAPDLTLLLGDRGEMLAGAIACRHLNIPIAHIGGGYLSGSIDDYIRDAITVFSDFHFVASKRCFERVISIGADPLKTYIVGAPDLEAIRKKDFSEPGDVAQKLGIRISSPLILVSYHPVTEKIEESEDNMETICESVVGFCEEVIGPERAQVIITYPNADAGGRRIIKVIRKYAKFPFVQIHRHIPYKLYLGLMNLASVMVGNSSAGLIEAASFGLPVVNIGERQKGRERAMNVIDVRCKKEEIIEAIKRAVFDEEFIERANSCVNPYGDGDTSGRIMRMLEDNFLIK
ncbi:UDP-N-acetylglucosamine 2-epimerase (hydrolyzing) [Candidatus Aerophobetes bacterium]|nr:UDP-N-acetylglucosamine 2-epimerase (hydrolyzing) [Candidatus Aerophobetes bacterium]